MPNLVHLFYFRCATCTFHKIGFLLLFHLNLKGKDTDSIVVTEQLRESHERLNKEATVRFNSEAKYQRIVHQTFERADMRGSVLKSHRESREITSTESEKKS